MPPDIFSDVYASRRVMVTGKALKLVFTQPGQNSLLSFTGTTGQQIVRNVMPLGNAAYNSLKRASPRSFMSRSRTRA